MKTKRSLKLSFNAPVVLTFTIVCLCAQILNVITQGKTNNLLFSVYRSSFLNPLAYLRSILHVCGHAGWSHLMNNMMYILILGPMLEEKYGSMNILFVMLATALATGLLNLLLFPYHLLGASGIVFAMILLASITTAEKEQAADNATVIPVTFILVALLYIGQQVYEGITSHDNISQLTHIAGGAVGSALGFVMNRMKMTRYHRSYHA